MNIERIIRDIQKGIMNQIKYGNEPRYLICSQEIANLINDFHNQLNVDNKKVGHIFGLEIVVRENIYCFYVH